MASRKRCVRSCATSSYRLLEERRLLAGNVTVVENLHLYIRGDQADNQFEVVAENDELKINGLNGTTINGRDSYTVESATPTSAGVTFDGGLRAHLGPGNDDFSVRDIQFASLSVIYGGTGNDNVEVVESGFVERLTIQTFDGNDSVVVEQSQFDAAFTTMTLDGRDSVRVADSTFAGNSTVITGAHIDSVHSDGVQYLGEVNRLLTLGGNDSVQLDGPDVDQWLGVFLGSGDDTVNADMTSSNINGSVRIGGQGGIDEAPVMQMNGQAAANTRMSTIEHREVFGTASTGADSVEGFHLISQRSNEFYEWYAVPVSIVSSGTITSVEWSGVYLRDWYNQPLPDRGDSFVIEIYEDLETETQPGQTPVARFEVGSANRIDNGVRKQVRNLSGEIQYEYPVYDFSAEIDFDMQSGKQYWVSIWSELSEVELQEGNGWAWGWNSASSDAAFIQGWNTDPDEGGYHVAGAGGYQLPDLRIRT
ncbi:MAG: hypothetical protein AAF456_07700 [Planctomycetota bacterium]